MLLLYFSVISLMIICHTNSQVYIFPTATILSVNGSSAIGHCFSVTTNALRSDSNFLRCDTPTSSVLFDGNIPTLTGIDGDMWASQLLTLQTTNLAYRDIISDFTDTFNYAGVRRIELIMFNCPEWGISAQSIGLLTTSSISDVRTWIRSVNVNITSCNSLVRVCLSQTIPQPVIFLRFFPSNDSNITYLAEVAFYDTNSTCPPDTIINVPDTTTTQSSPPDTIINILRDATITATMSQMSDHSISPSQSDVRVCPSCSTSTALVSVISATATALLATVIFVLVQIAVCKCHPKFTPGGAETGTSAVAEMETSAGTETETSARGEGQEYEEVDGGEGGVPDNDPTYMEVGETTTFQLKENEACDDINDLQLEGNEALNFDEETSFFQLKGNEAYDETSPFQLKGNEAYDKTSPFQLILNEAYGDIKQTSTQVE